MSNTPDIAVQNLRKTYEVPQREPGLGAAIKSLVSRTTRDVEAVKNISFDVAPGEIVGFLGPNGAGKTTTLKMLSGLLHPTAGEISVIGHTPYARHKNFLNRITLVMGQRNQLMWDIPVADSFERNRAIYRISHGEYNKTLDELSALLDLSDLLSKPVRNLSLGERMKCEIAAALLHRPKILFLDEPTIGLDVTMQRRIRAFLGEYNRPAPHPRLPGRIQPPPQCHRIAHLALHGRCRSPVQARHCHSPRRTALRRRFERAHRTLFTSQNHSS